ncbi:TIGR04282 family arsenosugar biosynthesis glycosyltransferase [Geomonas subterranea]|uniref:TIGR04282 family arsenosugar biosynthesis glycosyltransferase n=1 Tax=Geomonas subterranea TaxID=2847989 RepID=A0ABX8LJH7_9BACT|nr:TIGR04282 family arsenosugar biosynthesis glycosyltransferase [Geomonas subterranea]QXE90398.1 TIGR04282 family arsenosugar biosynthesis glycosyltransferase [Geomonas subterranea]QXM11527.1 TIGR04282 family arsenosugar biosynthesis glycosyltransferase [Geomonas subterranea]
MKRALAIFAKTPLPGRVKTRLSPPLSPPQAAELYRCMLLDIIERSALLTADIVIFYEGSAEFFRKAAPEALLVRQSTGGLGVRLEHAFDELSGRGYGARVVIGTDSPDLPIAFVEEAFRKLEQGGEAVFGPAEDGGYYLVGVRDGYGTLFQDIPWSSGTVLESSLRQAEASGLTAALLTSWHDVDSWEDLLRSSLLEPSNRAPRTRAFIAALGLAAPIAADAV